jgi:hypothetical protein
MQTPVAGSRLSTPTLHEYLASLPILDRQVLIFCCTEGHPIENVCDWLDISPRHIARILLNTLQFTEHARVRGLEGPAALMTRTLDTQARKYLEVQDCARLMRPAAPSAPFGSAFANYGAN